MIAALACHLKGPAINTYTVRVDAPELDELDAANLVARHIKTKPPIVQEFRAQDALDTYPQLIRAAEAPVIDTSCAALLQLARRVHENGQKVVLTGEGADEWLVGYPWYKAAKILDYLDIIPGLPLERCGASSVSPSSTMSRNIRASFGAASRRRSAAAMPGSMPTVCSAFQAALLFRIHARRSRDSANPWADLQMPLERAKRWHPLNRGIWVAGRVTLAGLLLQAKGDRVAMHSSVEVRYPFLDEDVFAFLARLDPRWKLRGLRDKHLLRLLAERWVPKSVYQPPARSFFARRSIASTWIRSRLSSTIS